MSEQGPIKAYIYDITITKHDGTTQNFKYQKDEVQGPPSQADIQLALNEAKKIGPTNLKLLQFILDNYSKQIGDGQCYAVGKEAMQFAGCQPPNMYTFGKPISNLSDVAPGDIMQFNWAKYVGKTPNGNNYTKTAGSEKSQGHHTAVVFLNKNNGKEIVCLEQNIGGYQKVMHRSYVLGDKVSGEH